MTFTQIIKDIFVKKSKDPIDNAPKAKKGRFKAFLAKLPGGFMLPIAVMSIGGLFMGIGSAIEINTSAVTFGKFLSSIGNPIFSAMPVLFLIAIIIAFTDEAGVAVFAGIVSFLVFNSMQLPFINVTEIDGVNYATFLGINTSLDIQEKMYNVLGSNLGMLTLNTSIFGSIIIGLIISWTYNHFYMIKLPEIISFFGGKRFVAIISIVFIIPLTFLFLLIWPWIGLGFAYFGEYSGKVAGLDSFGYGFMERATLPLGLAWPLSLPLTYTSAGGDVLASLSNWIKNGGEILAINGSETWGGSSSLNDSILNAIANTGYAGDALGWLSINGLGIENITYRFGDGSIQTEAIFPFLDNQVGINLGRFGIGGLVPIQQFGMPAAALAMVMAAPKNRRKEAFATCFPAAMTSFLVGVTEPLEYTFLFLAPALFFGFHSIMEGLSFLFANLLNVHFTTTFSGGFIDTMIYGAIPIAKGTAFYWSYVIGVIYAPIYFFVFYWWIKHFDIKTPGRGTTTRLFTKKDYKKDKKDTLTIQEALLIKAMGGWENILSYNTCVTRLRYDIKDKSLVNEKAIKEAGAVGVVWNGDNLQTIIGMGVEQMNTNIKKNRNADLDLILKKEKNE